MHQGKVVWATGAAIRADDQDPYPPCRGRVKASQRCCALDRARVAESFVDPSAISCPHYLDGTSPIGIDDRRDFDDGTPPRNQLDANTGRQGRAALRALQNRAVIAAGPACAAQPQAAAPCWAAPLIPAHPSRERRFKIGFGMAPKMAQVHGRICLIDDRDTIPPTSIPAASLYASSGQKYLGGRRKCAGGLAPLLR